MPHLPRRAEPARAKWDRMLTFEAAAVVVLLVALIGSIASRGFGSNQPNAVISAVAEQESGVAMYRENAARTGVSTEAGPETVPEVAWSHRLNGGRIAGSVAADGVVFVAIELASSQHPSKVEARTIETGTILWTREMENLSAPALLFADDRLFVSTEYAQDENGIEPGHLIALDAATGKELWIAESGGTRLSSPVLSDGVIYVLGEDHQLHAFDARSGEQGWSLDIATLSSEASGKTPFREEISGLLSPFSPSIVDGIILITAGDGLLYAIDLDTRSVVWHFETDGNSVETPAVVGGRVFFSACDIDIPTEPYDPAEDHCWIYALDAATGQELARHSSTFGMSVAAVSPQVLIARDGDQTVLLSTSDLSALGAVPDRELAEPAVTADRIYVSDHEGSVIAYRYSAAGVVEEIWKVYTGSSLMGAPQIARGLLIIPGADSSDSIIALGVGSATPVAEAGIPVDLSGLPACTPPPPVDWTSVTGEPEFTIDAVAATSEEGGYTGGYGLSSSSQAWMDFDDVPTGTGASAEANEGIAASIQAMIDCLKPGVTEDVSGFFTEDFYRRDWVKSQIEQGAPVESWFLGGLFPNFLKEVQTATVLPDGRVAILADPADPHVVEDFAMFVVFVERDGYWVVDESIRVGAGANMG
jgi:outer membrane protein assembly factor BamB